jgi:hypothetical protein
MERAISNLLLFALRVVGSSWFAQTGVDSVRGLVADKRAGRVASATVY